MIHAAAIKLAAGVLAAGGLTVGGVAVTESCPAGEQMTVRGCGVVKEFPDESHTQGNGISSSVTPSGGVNFRDQHGNRTSSGLSTEDQFEWTGGKKQGKNGDGTLIEVIQTTHGKGGWGPLYRGWIPVKYTQLPSMFKSAPASPEPTSTPGVETEQGG